jgi:hypothetical protein
LVSNWKDIDKLTITAASIFFKYSIISNIDGKSQTPGSVEIKLMTRYKKIEKIFLKFSIEEGMNEIKRILITLIIVSGLFPDNKEIIIEINKKFFVELENFRDEVSNRKKLDFKNYALLFQIFTEKSLRVSFSYDILEEMSEFDVKIETMKKEPDLMDNASSMLDISIYG